ncbi:MAG: phosphoribosyl transferase [Acidithiobacillales bacterium SG8_45]|jgi:putative phosphoribosyl transferase|nr:MAG: phosphoribosyl transferase [Acidithiobacillales bacterium SG8_45]
MRFHDRIDAGKQLADLVAEKYKGTDSVIYPLPRGGVPLGIEVARVLAMPLDLVIPRKIGHPYNPEYAICAVAETGETVCNERELARVDKAWFEQRVAEEREESRRRRELYLAGRSPAAIEGKTAILVDDGIATGLTMRAAIKDMRARKAARVVVAIPVVPEDTAALLAREVDDVVALSIDVHYMGAVGAYYDDFSQVSDQEVLEMMQQLDDRGLPK